MMPVIFLSGLGIFAMMADAFRFGKWARAILALGLLLALGSTFLPTPIFFAPFLGSGMVSFDPYSLIWTRLLLTASFFIFLFYPVCFDLSFRKYNQEALLIFSTLGAVLLTSFSHLVMLFLAIEILSVPLYILAGAEYETREKSQEASLKYFLMGSFASAILLFGIALVFVSTGHFDCSDIVLFAHQNGSSLLLQGGSLLILIGLLFKVGVVPFHFWVPDVYEGSPLIYTAFMSTIVKIAAFAGLYRLLASGFASILVHTDRLIWIFAGLSMVIGALMALQQKSMKRLMAYSGIGHAGFMLIPLVMGSASILFYYALSYALGSLVVFFALALDKRETTSDNVSDLSGMASRNPFAAFLFIIGLLSLAGIPPTTGFFGKYLVISYALSGGYFGMVVLAIISSLLGAYLYFSLVALLFRNSEPEFAVIKVSLSSKLIGFALVILTLLAGLCPGLL